ncbi:MAG: VCBS repeat-containing protein, partial [Oscillochloris sp.]|nr:VCBS repeat-containing protein [Oscillochloris sp.]
DPIQTLVAADMDSDGDLDLIAGQLGGQSAVYVNDGTGSLAARRTFGGASAQATSLATGDLDNDGDQDLVVGRADQASLIYRNAEYGASLSAFVAPQISVRTPGPVARPTGSASATIINTPVISVSYRLSRPVAAVVGTYSLDGGGSWLPAVTSAGLTQIAAPQPGSDGSYSYAWDTFASGFFGQSDTVVFRLEAYPATSDFPGADAGSQQQPYIAAQTYPFRARGTQVRVLDEDGQPVSGAVVYRLEAGQSRGGTPLSDTSGTPFQTAANGYLQGRGLLTPGDRIVALVPHVISDTFTLYDTSAPVTSAGPQMSAVTNSGVQTLTVKASNPLLLFDLEIALEWDARSDSAFLARLSDDLERTSEILYDWSDGQIALGDITLYHDARRIYYDDGWDMWSYANVRLFASNGLRPNADRGGIVVTNTLDPDLLHATEPPYVPGQVRMAATWNRFGDSSGTIGEDWPRTLAHELSHYLLFLDDNYLGLDAEGVLIPVSGCPGAMADPYRDDYSEFHPAGVEWEQNANCQLTLSEVESNRADWASILSFYPKAGLQAPASYDANSGPGVLPLNLGQISAAPVLTATNALTAPFFSLEVEVDGATESYVAGSSARAFLFQRAAGGDTPWLIDLGAPVVDRVEARGAAPGDHVCVFEIEAQEQGCVQVTTGNQPLQLAATPGWRPEVVVTPVTSSTLQLVVTNLAEDDALAPAVPATLTARLYPIDRASPPALSFTLPRGTDGRYAAIVQLDQPTFGGYLLISADDSSGRVAVVDYALGGNPGRKWAGTAPRGNPGRKWAGTTPRSNPGRKWAGTAPVLSGDGQAILYTKAEFAEGEFYAIQTASVPDVPTWATRVGHAYQVTATDNAPALDAASISIGYLSRDVPDGAESYLGLFYLDDTTWLPLDTRQNEAANLLSAPLQGPGLYAIFASVRLPAFDDVGWHQFAYPITGIRPISDALSSISGDYTMVYRDTGGDLGARWQLYAPGAPAYVSDLEALRFAESYAIYITTTTTIRLRPAAATTTSTMAVPATIYGSLKTASGFAAGVEVTAKVGTVLCGRTQTKQQDTTGEIVFSVQVEADSVATVSGCGALGRSVQLFYNGQVLGDPIAWDNTRLSIFSMVNGAPDVRVYLPLLRK